MADDLDRAREVLAEQYAEGPQDGHTFRIEMTSRGSSRTVGDPTYTDNDWWSDPWHVEVRAWNLTDALRKAAELPLVLWRNDKDQFIGGPIE
jgi:hypothetical protein